MEVQKQRAKIEILSDWQDSLAVFKPAGWLSIPGRGSKIETPVLSHLLGEQLRNGSVRKGNDLFVVHRLDEGTSGVIVFARTPEVHRELSGLFETREIKKTYWCLVKGIPQNQTIDLPLFKIPSKKIKSVVDSKGKPSQTVIQVKATQDDISLVEAQPLTGRSHQIRVHLAHIGFPLLGDVLYGGAQQALSTEFAYPLLHARHISFKRPLLENPKLQGEKAVSPQNFTTPRKGMGVMIYEATASLRGVFENVAASLGFVPSCSSFQK